MRVRIQVNADDNAAIIAVNIGAILKDAGVKNLVFEQDGKKIRNMLLPQKPWFSDDIEVTITNDERHET